MPPVADFFSSERTFDLMNSVSLSRRSRSALLLRTLILTFSRSRRRSLSFSLSGTRLLPMSLSRASKAGRIQPKMRLFSQPFMPFSLFISYRNLEILLLIVRHSIYVLFSLFLRLRYLISFLPCISVGSNPRGCRPLFRWRSRSCIPMEVAERPPGLSRLFRLL